MNAAVIELKRITKSYIISGSQSLFSNLFAKSLRKKNALSDVSLTINRGEILGLIGFNGAGKTTLLKVISRISYPSYGEISTKGRIVSLIDLDSGFHLELSGRENIYLNGLLLGLTRKEIKNVIDNIILFAGLGEYIDSPVYMYSSGMKFRLGFSIAVHTNPDILILDELFVVGDADFQKKCVDTLKHFIDSGVTIIVSSHWLEFLETVCTRYILLDQGKIIADGDLEVLNSYKKRIKKKLPFER